MYLKKLIAHGFKSFADNITIDFNQELTGIVGPNGSGKSNIVDAIRWVLGEQSIKSLRGDTQTDVIFSGSKSRREMNVASVCLIFDNSDHYINIAYDEVSIKRRLYKDGTNEYLLNGEKVRLKDIHNILLDSGIAKESFNIISQGKIEDIISSKPENRRVIFEEAARVIKYKKRKEEALRKLNRTNQNMNRVQDIIRELEMQINPLKEAKEKALVYQEVDKELKQLEISLIVTDITSINEVYLKNKENIKKLKEELTILEANNSKTESESYKIKNDLNICNDELNKYQGELLNITKKIEQINSQKNIILERKKYEVDNIKLHNNIVLLKEEQYKLQNEINSLKREVEVLGEEKTQTNKTIGKLEKELMSANLKKDNILAKLDNKIVESSKLKREIDVLKESIDHNSSLPYPVKKVLDNPRLTGIHNTLGNIIEVEEKYSKAISVALVNANNIITDNEKSAYDAIKYLKNNNLGRATFLPLNIIKEKYINKEMLNLISIDGFIGIASNLVKYNKIYANIVKNQLGNIIIVNNLDTAGRLSKLINFNYRIITLDGEVINVGGSITGGSTKFKNIISEKYELETKIKEYTTLQAQVSEYENQINEVDEEIKIITDKLYLVNKDNIKQSDLYTFKNNKLSDYLEKYQNINTQIEGTNNIINDELAAEEESVIKEYYETVDIKNEILSKIDKLNNKKAELSDLYDNYLFSIKKDNNNYNEKCDELKNLEISINRNDVKLDTLLNTLSSEYTLTYEKAKEDYTLSMDYNVAKNKVSVLKKKINDLGVVNLGAITEFERVNERYDFLLKQKNDLNDAQKTLLDIINEMDEIMKKDFLETFNDISKNFEKTFQELFHGGVAKLELTDKNNLLETGIDIIVSPPGKNLKSINLLSGGEKTFTAIALLFAILKTRTMPFCVLDEVEAALDDVNVDSFGHYITSLKNKTQFIIITHKKKTMEYVNTLYGITMQESGVSKLVSVKLEDIEDKK